MASARTILLTGASGQLGKALQRCPLPAGWTIVPFDRAALDLCDRQSIEHILHMRPWSAVINAAAYTAVDRAEDEASQAWQINTVGPAVLGSACAAAGIPIVHVSTDYVFSGQRHRPWQVNDDPHPINAYGASKRGGEVALLASGARHAIVRTSWLFGPSGSNFLKTILWIAATRDRVAVVADQRGRPTSTHDLADFLLMLAVRLCNDPHAPTGLFHFANAGEASWAEFAIEIFRLSAERGGPTASVEPIPSSSYPTRAARPANSVLDLDRIHESFGTTPRHWEDALSDVLDELIGESDERHRSGRRNRHTASSSDAQREQTTFAHL